MKKQIIITLLSFLILPFCTLYAGDKPLSLKSSSPENGAESIAVDTTINLVFSNNVVNMKVASHNRECFQLLDQKGMNVDITVELPDDQIEPENKRNIAIIPVAPLNPGFSYKLIISSELKSKNGTTLGEDITVMFTTAP